MAPDPIQQINSSLWRHGHPAWTEAGWPPDGAVFLEFKADSIPRYTPPKAEQHLRSDDKSHVDSNLGVPVHTAGLVPAHRMDTAVSNISTNTAVPVLESTYYYDTIHSHSSLEKVLSKLSSYYTYVYHWHCQASHKDQECDCGPTESFAFLVLLRTHQKLYGQPDGVRMAQPRVSDSGVLVVTSRHDLEAGERIGFNIAPPIVNPIDTRLVYLLVMHHHVAKSSQSQELHLGHSGTVAQLRRGKYAVWIPNSPKRVRDILQRCPTCTYVFGSPATPPLGSPRWIRMVSETDCIWRYVSVDSVGPYIHRLHPGSKKTTKYWALYVYCLVTRGLNIELMEQNSREALHCALYNHSCTVAVTPFHVFADAGSSALPDVSSHSYKKYFSEPMTTSAYGAHHQFLNQAERQIQGGKKLLKSVYKQRDRLKLPSMHYSETRALLNSICVALNSIPVIFNASVGAPVSPIHFRAPYTITSVQEGETVESVPHTLTGPTTPVTRESADDFFQRVSSLQSNLCAIHNFLGEKNQTLVRVLKQNYSLSSHRFLQNKSKVKFCKDDVILVLKATGVFFGLILEAFPSHASVRLADQSPPKTATVHYKNAILIYRASADPSLDVSPLPAHDTVMDTKGDVPESSGSIQLDPRLDPNAAPYIGPHASDNPPPTAGRRSQRILNKASGQTCRSALYSRLNKHALLELF